MNYNYTDLQDLLAKYKALDYLLTKKDRNHMFGYLTEKRDEIFISIDKLLRTPGYTLLSDDIIDLRSTSANLIKGTHIYRIYKHESNEYLGNIEYRGNPFSLYRGYEGNVGYIIDEQYRGHGYAFAALKLMSDLLSQEGIKEIFIATYRGNTPSVKTIQKFGGTLIEEYCTNSIALYRCELRLAKKSQNK